MENKEILCLIKDVKKEIDTKRKIIKTSDKFEQIVKKYEKMGTKIGTDMDLDEYTQIIRISIFHAIKTFDVKKRGEFSTHAYWAMKYRLQEHWNLENTGKKVDPLLWGSVPSLRKIRETQLKKVYEYLYRKEKVPKYKDHETSVKIILRFLSTFSFTEVNTTQISFLGVLLEKHKLPTYLQKDIEFFSKNRKPSNPTQRKRFIKMNFCLLNTIYPFYSFHINVPTCESNIILGTSCGGEVISSPIENHSQEEECFDDVWETIENSKALTFEEKFILMFLYGIKKYSNETLCKILEESQGTKQKDFYSILEKKRGDQYSCLGGLLGKSSREIKQIEKKIMKKAKILL